MATFPTYTDQVLVEGEDKTTFYEAAEDIKEGQVVKADQNSTARTIEPSDTGSENLLVGVALQTRSSGEMVNVATTGAIVRAVSGTGSISSGQFVCADDGTNGAVKERASGSQIIGQAVQADTGTDTEGSVIIEICKFLDPVA